MSLDTTAHEPLNLPLLLSVLHIQSYSGKEEQARIFLRSFLTEKGIPFYEAKGNLYATKDDYSGDTVPYACVVSHIDTVHAIVAEKILYWKDTAHNELYAGGPAGKDGKFTLTGIGGDDLVGIFLCLSVLLALPKVKVAFFHSEEVGLN